MFSSKFQGMRATGRITLTVNRHTGSGGEYVNGKWVESVTEPVELKTVNVQPLAYKETVLMEAADRSKKSLKVYSADPIYSQAENEQGADTFEWEGDLFEVIKAENYSMSVLDHWKAIAVMKEKIDEPV
mgnify:CR=1 FL=1